MMTKLLSWLFLIFLILLLSGRDGVLVVTGQCREDQKSLLLTLKDLTASANSSKLVRWNGAIDCCLWDGVSCDSSGYVIELKLDNQTLSEGFANSSSLVGLQYLERLNLAYNNFYGSTIPSGLFQLTSLTYLNLSNAGFAGEISRDLGNLRRLVALDLSTRFPGVEPLKFENQNLEELFQNLTELADLYLDGVNISAPGSVWCNALSSLSNLRALSLSTCHLSGPIDAALSQLSSLSVINLASNNLSASIPDFIANFANLTVLSLSSSSLKGTFPQKILQIPTLQILDLSNNHLINGIIPELPMNGSLRILELSYTNFSGTLPDSIGFLRNLSKIDLSNSNFSGPIPSSMAALTELAYVDFSFNSFNGSIPPLQKSKNLNYMDLSQNGLTGNIPSTHFEDLSNLSFINLESNSLTGIIPLSLFTLQSLQNLQLSNNKFKGQITDFPDATASRLDTLDLSGNQLEGSVPNSFFELKGLNVLSLSRNSFNGSLQLERINSLPNLTKLELSYNNLSVHVNSSDSIFPQLSALRLASCNLKKFPDLRNQSRMVYLDLSENQIAGQIPRWIWGIGGGSLLHLNLSCNLLEGLDKNYTVGNLLALDLHSNQLQGDFPIPPATAIYVDYSFNNFSNSIPSYAGSSISMALFFSLSSNSLSGAIPGSFCNASYLQVLDLSNNSFTGSMPDCLFSMEGLKVLQLGTNSLSGTIPDKFPTYCTLKTLDLSRNSLEGKIPGSLANCTSLEVLNIGSNRVEDSFPCMLKNSTSLRVLVLRANMFHGNLICSSEYNGWQNLQIIDVAFNKFDGPLPSGSNSNWRRMFKPGENGQSGLNTNFLRLTNLYYQDTLRVTLKGRELELVKILTVFTSIDLSSNNFEGSIPDTVGELRALYFLNLSHNSLSGTIPHSIGNLMQLESLDLSRNQLTGVIPVELTNLTFLSFLNLSFNQLFGRIPSGHQFETFEAMSFEGNTELCGFPLNRNCNSSELLPEQSPVCDTNFDWQFIFSGLGFGVGVAVVLAPQFVCKEVRECFDQYLGRTFQLIFPRSRFVYIRYEEGKVEEWDTFEDDTQNSDEDEQEEEDEAFERKYCVYCSKLDLHRLKVVHDPKCTCRSTEPVYLNSPTSTTLLLLYHKNL